MIDNELEVIGYSKWSDNTVSLMLEYISLGAIAVAATVNQTISNQRFDLLKLFVANGSNLNDIDIHYKTSALSVAIRRGNIDAVRVLVEECGVGVNHLLVCKFYKESDVNKVSILPLHLAAISYMCSLYDNDDVFNNRYIFDSDIEDIDDRPTPTDRNDILKYLLSKGAFNSTEFDPNLLQLISGIQKISNDVIDKARLEVAAKQEAAAALSEASESASEDYVASGAAGGHDQPLGPLGDSIESNSDIE